MFVEISSKWVLLLIPQLLSKRTHKYMCLWNIWHMDLKSHKVDGRGMPIYYSIQFIYQPSFIEMHCRITEKTEDNRFSKVVSLLPWPLTYIPEICFSYLRQENSTERGVPTFSVWYRAWLSGTVAWLSGTGCLVLPFVLLFIYLIWFDLILFRWNQDTGHTCICRYHR